MKLYFEPGPTTDYSTRDLTAYKLAYTANSTTNSNIVAGQVAEGVQIRIANLDGTQIPMGENAAGQNGAASIRSRKPGNRARRKSPCAIWPPM